MWPNGFISASNSVCGSKPPTMVNATVFGCQHCLLENVSFLLLNGCNPNAKNVEGNSPLLTGKLTPWLWRTVQACVSSRPRGFTGAALVHSCSTVTSPNWPHVTSDSQEALYRLAYRWGKESAQLWADCLPDTSTAEQVNLGIRNTEEEQSRKKQPVFGWSQQIKYEWLILLPPESSGEVQFIKCFKGLRYRRKGRLKRRQE